jgi:hypothetical protein
MNELLVGLLVAVVGAALSALIAYPLGRAQGKQQTVFEEQAKVMAELRELVMETDKALFFAATFPHEEDSQDELGNKIVALGDYHRKKSVWLDRQLNAKLERTISGYDDQARALVTGHHGIPPPPHLRGMDEEGVYEEVKKWYWDEGQVLVEELESEARELLGVDSAPW